MIHSLVIAPQWIGDAVMTEPLMRCLADRGEQVSVAAVPWVAPIYQAMSSVTEVIELPFKHGGLQWSLRRATALALKGRFQRAYLGPNSLKSALLPWLAGIPERIGYHGESRYALLTRRLPNPPRHSRGSMVAHYLALADNWQPSGALPAPRLDLPIALLKTALQAQQLGTAAYVVMVPGAEYGPAKRWPARHFAAVAAQMRMPVLLLGSGKEADACADIAAQSQALGATCVRSLAGTTSLSQAMALIAAAHSVLSNDSGLMHVAAAFGVPQVAVFGSSSPLHTPPLNERAQVLWLKSQAEYQPPLDCAPCYARSYPLGHTRCLNDVSPAMVAQAWQSVVRG